MESVINHSRVFPFDYLDKLLKVASRVLDRDVVQRQLCASDSPFSSDKLLWPSMGITTLTELF